jgi:hypothetical protein
MVVQLLLDLQADTLSKDKNGKTAADFAMSHGHKKIVEKVLAASQPPVDEQGKAIFTWDTCEHSGKDLHLDLDKGYLVCTACGLILKENAVVFNTDSDGKIRKTEKVRGADSEYNDWRSEEMDLAELMSSVSPPFQRAARNHPSVCYKATIIFVVLTFFSLEHRYHSWVLLTTRQPRGEEGKTAFGPEGIVPSPG